MKVLLDMDGVLVDFVGGACRLHGVPNPYKSLENRGIYDIGSLINVDYMWDAMGEEFWANLNPTPMMDLIVGILSHRFGATNVCLMTSPVRTPGCTKGKMRWIEKHLPDYRRRFLIGPAKEFCAHEDSLLVDDYEVNIHRFDEAGGNTFLYPALWNKDHAVDAFASLCRYIEAI